jgi:hypothetical protein
MTDVKNTKDVPKESVLDKPAMDTKQYDPEPLVDPKTGTDIKPVDPKTGKVDPKVTPKTEAGVTQEHKDKLLEALFAEHKRLNGIPRYRNIMEALEYYGITHPAVEPVLVPAPHAVTPVVAPII